MGGGGGDDVEPKESAQERELAAISKEQVDRWWNVGKPAQMQWIEDGLVDENDRSLMGDAVSANMHQQAQGLRAKDYNEASSRGASPVGGNAIMGKAGTESTIAETAGKAQAMGQHGMTNKNTGHMMNVTSVLRGEGANAQSGMATLAQQATEDSIFEANKSLYENSTDGDSVGAAVGMGLSGLEEYQRNKDSGA